MGFWGNGEIKCNFLLVKSVENEVYFPYCALHIFVPVCRMASPNYKSFTCRVVHSLPLKMSVVQVFQQANMVAVAHLIGTEQLPTDISARVSMIGEKAIDSSA